jgi:hypothetical protein
MSNFVAGPICTFQVCSDSGSGMFGTDSGRVVSDTMNQGMRRMPINDLEIGGIGRLFHVL